MNQGFIIRLLTIQFPIHINSSLEAGRTTQLFNPMFLGFVFSISTYEYLYNSFILYISFIDIVSNSFKFKLELVFVVPRI